MDFLTAIVVGTVGSLIVAEMRANSRSVAEWLIKLAVKRLPRPEQARFREEWLAHLAYCPGSLTKLWHSVGCFVGAAELARIVECHSRATADTQADDNSNTEVRIDLVGSEFKKASVIVGRKGSGKAAVLASIVYKVQSSGRHDYGDFKICSKNNRRKSRKPTKGAGRI